MQISRAHVWVHGYVQGVNFRAVCQKQATQSNVTGWVSNASDGGVEAVFEGDLPSVERMVEWCHKGPRLARVKSVDVQWEEPQQGFEGFSVRR